jgi:hypothetical protein
LEKGVRAAASGEGFDDSGGLAAVLGPVLNLLRAVSIWLEVSMAG